jgi:hypothetical protein
LTTPPPSYLFTLGNLRPANADVVEELVRNTWALPEVAERIRSILSESAGEEVSDDSLLAYIYSVRATVLPWEEAGRRSVPRYNIYIDPPTNNPTRWNKFRQLVVNLNYEDDYLGTGTAMPFSICGFCHSVDHPRGLCPLTQIIGRKSMQLPPAGATNGSRNGSTNGHSNGKNGNTKGNQRDGRRF